MRQQGQTFLKIDIPLLIAALFVLSLTTHAAYAHAGDDHNVFQANTKSGDGYIELPVGDRIREVYCQRWRSCLSRIRHRVIPVE